jgi:hypothetical protein
MDVNVQGGLAMGSQSKRAGQRSRLSLRSDERGAAYVEFLLVFIPVFMMFLGMIQAAMMYAANLVVSHAATTAARAASVVLDDQESRYGDEERNSLSGSGGGGDSPMDSVGGLLEWAGLGGSSGGAGGSGGSSSDASGARLAAIRSAASIPLLAVSPSMSQLIGSESVYSAIGGNPAERGLTGAAVYNRTAVAVTFPTERGGTDFKTDFEENEDVTVRVTYLFHCAVPLVNRIMCDDIVSLKTGVPLAAVQHLASRTASGDASLEEISAMIERVQDGRDRLARSSPGVSELDSAESPWLSYLTAVTGARFTVMRAEATMPNHGASYSYVE